MLGTGAVAVEFATQARAAGLRVNQPSIAADPEKKVEGQEAIADGWQFAAVGNNPTNLGSVHVISASHPDLPPGISYALSVLVAEDAPFPPQVEGMVKLFVDMVTGGAKQAEEEPPAA